MSEHVGKFKLKIFQLLSFRFLYPQPPNNPKGIVRGKKCLIRWPEPKNPQKKQANPMKINQYKSQMAQGSALLTFWKKVFIPKTEKIKEKIPTFKKNWL